MFNTYLLENPNTIGYSVNYMGTSIVYTGRPEVIESDLRDFETYIKRDPNWIESLFSTDSSTITTLNAMESHCNKYIKDKNTSSSDKRKCEKYLKRIKAVREAIKTKTKDPVLRAMANINLI